jgi:hypothetical protein
VAVFELIAGKHSQAGRFYKAGDRIDTSLDLVKMFGANKFREIQPLPETSVVATLPSEPPQAVKKGVKIASKKSSGAEVRGEKSSHPLATEHGLEVFSRDKLFFVYEEGETTPLNKKGLKKAELTAFITEFLEK